MTKKKVVIVGGGFAGINAAKELANSEFDVLLIDKENHHLFQPLLYQVASAALSPGDIAVPIREIIAKAKNIKVFQHQVENIDKDKNTITVDDGTIYNFDYLILGVGATPFYFGKKEWQEFAPGLKTLGDALEIRSRVLSSYEKAEKCKQDEEREAYLNFVVIGGGPTGVELAGAFSEIAQQTLINDFRNIDSKKANVYLIEGAKHILPVYPEKLGDKAQSYLEALGVNVITNKRVEEITADSILIDGQKIKTKNVVWAAGNKASPLLDKLKVDQDRMGRIFVEKDLSIKNYSHIFVLGDGAHFKDAKGIPLPGLAPVASQQGKFLGKLLKGHKNREFKYLDKGSMATIGKFKAVLLFRKIQMAGFFAWISWCFVHILFLIDFRNKVMVFLQWALALFFHKRGVRLITKGEGKLKD